MMTWLFVLTKTQSEEDAVLDFLNPVGGMGAFYGGLEVTELKRRFSSYNLQPFHHL
jgi:hypothetical protein